MTPTWSEVKKAIREVVCPAFFPLGFTNPGITMWRYREPFVDVIHFYYNGNMSGFAIELGCHPRKVQLTQPRPWDCIFRARIHHSDKSICLYGLYRFADTIEMQRQTLLRLVPEVVSKSSAWLSQFNTISGAIKLLEESSEVELANLTLAGKNSPAYKNDLATLQSLVDMDTKRQL